MKNYILKISKLNNKHKAIIFMLMATSFFVIMGLFVKKLSQRLPAIEIAFFRNFTNFLIVFYLLLLVPNKKRFLGGHPFLLAMRGIVACFAIVFLFYNLEHMPISYAMTFDKTSPIFTAFFASLLLKEKLSRSTLFYLFISFCAVVYIINPEGNINIKFTITGLFSGILAGFVYTIVRNLRAFYSSRIIIASLGFFGSIIPAIFMFAGEFISFPFLDFLFSPFILPRGQEWGLILCVGILSALAQVFMTEAYKRYKAGIIGLVSYNSIIFSVFLDFFIINYAITWNILIAMFLIILCGIMAVKSKGKENSPKKTSVD